MPCRNNEKSCVGGLMYHFHTWIPAFFFTLGTKCCWTISNYQNGRLLPICLVPSRSCFLPRLLSLLLPDLYVGYCLIYAPPKALSCWDKLQWPLVAIGGIAAVDPAVCLHLWRRRLQISPVGFCTCFRAIVHTPHTRLYLWGRFIIDRKHWSEMFWLRDSPQNAWSFDLK